MLIDLRDVTKTYPGAETPVLRGVTLCMGAGEMLALTGESGSGKSTLLHLIGGLDTADSGRVAVSGVDLTPLDDAGRAALRRGTVGVIFQQFNLLPYLTVLDNVMLPCRFSAVRAGRCGGSPLQAARGLLARVSLPEAAWTRRADALSVGQQQRVAAARALIGAPELVIADEPTSALDAALRDDFMSLLMDACSAAGSTLVFVSHDERLAGRFDERLSLPTLNRAAAAGTATADAAA